MTEIELRGRRRGIIVFQYGWRRNESQNNCIKKNLVFVPMMSLSSLPSFSFFLFRLRYQTDSCQVLKCFIFSSTSISILVFEGAAIKLKIILTKYREVNGVITQKKNDFEEHIGICELLSEIIVIYEMSQFQDVGNKMAFQEPVLVISYLDVGSKNDIRCSVALGLGSDDVSHYALLIVRYSALC